MINKEKIIIMTKLAMYDKKHGEADKKTNGFFRNDYVYWKNFWARAYAFCGALILAGLYALDKIVIKGTELFDIDYKQEGINILIFIIAVLAIITFFSTIKATREYTKVQERIDYHNALTKELDHITAFEKQDTKPLEGD